ncbi:hypothetical protein [Kineococcus terrestris]|uniref:hypothetical protein n=1 Tax=Kineococcus terrestris TaxID=2044856 RepID=UPI0034DAD016
MTIEQTRYIVGENGPNLQLKPSAEGIARRARILQDPTNSLPGQVGLDAHHSAAGQGSTPTSSSQAPVATQPTLAAAGGPTTPPPARSDTTPVEGPPAGASTPAPTTDPAVTTDPPSEQGTTPAAAASADSRPRRGAPLLLDPTLLLAAAALDDIERTANANANRLRMLTRDVEDSDGRIRGAGLTAEHPQVATLTAIVDTLKQLEKDATRNLEKAMKAHPLGPWVKAQAGVGNKQAARLLAAIGDPYWREDLLHEDGTVRVPAGPRTVSALWAYCGRHVIDGDAARRRKGQRANWSVSAGSRAYVIAEACIKQTGEPMKNGITRARSPYRDVYDARRAHTLMTHPEWTDAHSHNDAMRVTTKALLRDLWIEARRLHHEAAAH